jgi:hypothetical protein
MKQEKNQEDVVEEIIMQGENIKKDIEEIAEWLRIYKELKHQLYVHEQTCKHWSLKDIHEKSHHDPQFPDDVYYATCEFCGETNLMRNLKDKNKPR